MAVMQRIQANLTVNNFADPVQMIRSHYSGKLVDLLNVKMGA